MTDQWSIEMREGLLWTWPFDKLFFGRRAAHTFLRLLDENKNIVHEIHGVASIDIDDKPNVVRPNLRTLFNFLSLPFSSNKHLRLRVIHSDGEFNTPSFQRSLGTKILEGDKGKMLLLWNAALQAANEINDLKLPYRPLGVVREGTNCNTVTRNLCDVMGVHDIQTQTFTPGLSNRLKDVFNAQNWNQLWGDIKQQAPEIKNKAIENLQAQKKYWGDQISKFWGRWKP